MPDYEEFKRLRERKALETAAARRVELEQRHRAAVSAEHLTGDPAWDVYTSYLQAAIEGRQAEAREYDKALSNPDLVNPDEVMRARIGKFRCEAVIQALTAALALPKALREDGEKAKELLARIG